MRPMILAQNGLRRNRAGSRQLALGLVFLLNSAIAVFCVPWDREGAKAAWAEATRLREDLVTTSEPSRESYLKCIRTYQQVYTKDPHFGYSPDAIYESAKLFQDMGDKFGDLSYYRNAAKLYRFLTTDYDLSPRCPDALLRLGTISEGPLGDTQAAQDSYQKLRTRYRSSAAAASLQERDKNKGGNKPAPMSIPAPAVTSTPPQAPLPATAKKVDGPTAIRSINIQSNQDHTQVSIVSDGEVHYSKSYLANPDRVYIDLTDAKLDPNLLNKVFTVEDRFLKQVRVGQNRADLVRVVFDLGTPGGYSVSDQSEKNGVTVDFHPKGAVIAQAPGAQKAPPSAAHATEKIQQPPSTQIESKLPEPALPKAKPETTSQTQTQSLVPPARDGSELKPTGAKPTPQDKPDKEPQPAISAPAKEVGSAPVSSPSGKSNKAGVPPTPVTSDLSPLSKAALPTGTGDRTLTRMLGLKIGRIVLDPGHGGRDTGTIGPTGLLEKDLVLQVAKELQKLLEEKLGAQVILTRSDDSFVSLEERTAIANQQQADLFVSIHANSSTVRSVSGVETYFLDFARTDSAREVAARENATSDRNIRDLQDLIQKIALADKLQESRELAANIQKTLYGAVRKMIPTSQNRGVRSAPFIVLIGAHMPSVLAELAFISNPRDEKLLKKEANQQSLAEALFQGVEGYMKTLGSAVAQNHGNSK
jgi:N-acetylmuramoyl-L-alanine amidase